ncbi:MAG: hypothetical protein J6W00_02765 [Lentisphaeria bacterium]|nr:hypothetical protein [Lentisphaeria bacterium]
MKNKALKHYKRKKFFYRFFMRKSPRAGAMFGLAWMTMAIGVLPFVLFSILFCFSGFRDNWQIQTIAAIVSLFLLAAPFYIYGFLLCAYGISRIYRSVTKYKIVGSVAGAFGALFLPLLGVILIPVLICKKKYIGIWFAIAGTVFYVLNYFQYFNILSSVCLGTFCYLAALAFCKDKNRFSWKFMIPLCVAVASHLFFMGYLIKLQYDAKDYRNQLSQIIGRSVEIGDFWRRDAQGFPLDREPLKSLIANHHEKSFFEFEYKDTQIAQKKLQEYNKKYPAFVKAIHDFLQLPVSHVAHKVPEDGMLYSVPLPELNAFRESARYLAMKIAAKPNDKQLVKKCNNDLIKLRNWLFSEYFLLEHLVSIAIEGIRLNALENILRQEIFSKQEFARLIGEPIDWEKSLRYSYGGEAAGFKSALAYMNTPALWSRKNDIANVAVAKKYMPLFIDVNFHRDYRFALQNYIKAATVPSSLSGLEKAKLAEVDDIEIKRNFYILSGMLLPALGQLYIKSAQIADVRQMALLAAEVMEYRKQHGKLPEDLSFLPNVPLAKLDHKPLMYKKTKDGFRIFSHTDKGKKPDEKDTQYSYWVRLPKQAALPLEKLITTAEKELVKVYGKRVLKQRPWKITRSDEKSITLTGTFHGQGKGGVAEITLQKSNGKVLRMIHGK